MKIETVDLVAAGIFAFVALIGWWLWSGQGAVVWINNFLLMCGFG